MSIILTVNAYPLDQFVPDTIYQIKSTHAYAASEFGVNDAVSSLSSDSAKTAAVSKITGAGFGWVRSEVSYSSTIDYAPYDAAHQKIKAAGLKTLVLLTYPGSDKSHDDWKAYVTSVTSHFGSDAAAYEIMNEADNYLSAADYVTYASEARDIILAANSSAKIISTGITSRIEATNFWDGIKAAGGWGLFNTLGLHVYHSGNPEKVNFGGGDLVGELDRVVGNINKNGGGKTIWVTETGYASSIGADNQANWYARALTMMQSVSLVERVFIYRLYDGSGDTYGILNSSLAEKSSYSIVKDAVNFLSGAGSGTKLTPQGKTALDSLESVTKWDTTPTSNGSTTLSSVTGYTGNGMKIEYSFNSDSAYAIAEKNIAISGTPTAIASWINGDDTKNVWKFRFKDKNGETFQTDLGSIPAGWHYKQFSIGVDDAVTSWGGDGKIDFPISFNAIVLDRQGGAASASGIVDEIIAISGSADLNAYQFGANVAYWKASGSNTATLCGATRTFTETPQYLTGVSCSDTPTSTTTSSSSSSSSSTTTTSKKKSTSTGVAKTATTVVKLIADKAKTTIRADGASVIADNKSSYKLVVIVKDASDKIIIEQKPTITVSGNNNTVSDTVLIGNEWITEIKSSEAGEKEVTVKVGDTDLGSIKITFVAIPEVKSPPKIELPIMEKPIETKDSPINRWLALSIGIAALGLVVLLTWRLRAMLLKHS